MRCGSSVIGPPLTLISRSTSYRPCFNFSLSRITSAACDVLANFLRLSTFTQPVNFFFLSLSFSFYSATRSEASVVRTAQYQNIETPERTSAEHSAPGASQINCSGLGGFRQALGLKTVSTLGLRSDFPLQTAHIQPEPRCEAYSLLPIQSTALFTFVQLTGSSHSVQAVHLFATS